MHYNKSYISHVDSPVEGPGPEEECSAYRGPQGDPGPPGLPGKPGVKGSAGLGLPGLDGWPGEDGPKVRFLQNRLGDSIF